VTLPASFGNKTPCILWLCPAPASGFTIQQEYDCIWCESHAAETSSKKSQGGLNSAGRGVKSVGAGEFELHGSHYNVAGVTYTYVAIAEGVDEPPQTVVTFPPPGTVNTCPWREDDSPTCDPKYPTWPEDTPGLLGVVVGIRQYVAPNTPLDDRTYKVACEQRGFPVREEQREFPVSCEQRTFDALAEYP
jgi:hypothetical protein